ncbi:peptidoglycan/LPS O-acetylase OafA/YrhL [Thioclava sp. ES.031]|uniref:acyltransferase family protein n=1 Tax=Thioclava sp. ES.031 TaxID=1798203 RepID=UPI000BFA1CD0|nr:acyltransferase [Thioclava sp. ES.031]PFG62644.1 peptidoglycan/LPS O-acetylase OafA/YrhL [Thioclava sp. ES.031]
MRQSFAPLATGQDNNLNLIRLVAAFCVLVSHAWPISLGPQALEPLEATTGFSLGALAVFVFFAISGFLISASFERSSSPWRYVRARIARIYPGLIVSISLVTFIMGPVLTRLSPMDYLASTDTWRAWLGNVSLLRLDYHLPGVFENNPYPTVQGSLWTLPVEMRLYVVVALIGVLGLLRKPLPLMGAVAVGLFALRQTEGLEFTGAYALRSLWYPGLPFFLGMALYLMRARIPASAIIAFGLVVVAVISAHGPLAYPAMALATSYGALWLAGLPSGRLREFNRAGDYSYGVYIYAFPMQGLVVALLGEMGPLSNIALATPITLALAVLSWHWVERPAMRILRRKPIPQANSASQTP